MDRKLRITALKNIVKIFARWHGRAGGNIGRGGSAELTILESVVMFVLVPSTDDVLPVVAYHRSVSPRMVDFLAAATYCLTLMNCSRYGK